MKQRNRKLVFALVVSVFAWTFSVPLLYATPPPAVEKKLVTIAGRKFRFLWVDRWNELFSANCLKVTGPGKGEFRCFAFDAMKAMTPADLPADKACKKYGGSEVKGNDGKRDVLLCKFSDKTMVGYSTLETSAQRNTSSKQ